jgi:hypothetical protein
MSMLVLWSECIKSQAHKQAVVHCFWDALWDEACICQPCAGLTRRAMCEIRSSVLKKGRISLLGRSQCVVDHSAPSVSDEAADKCLYAAPQAWTAHIMRRVWFCCPSGERSLPPATQAQQPLEILPRGEEQCLAVHPPEPAQPEAVHAVPLLALGKERLDPHRTLAHRLGIRLARVIRPFMLQIRFLEVAMHRPSMVARRAGRFDATRTGHALHLAGSAWYSPFSAVYSVR